MFLMQFCLLNAVIPLDKVKTHRLVQHKSHKLLGQLRQAKVTVCIKKIYILHFTDPLLVRTLSLHTSAFSTCGAVPYHHCHESPLQKDCSQSLAE